MTEDMTEDELLVYIESFALLDAWMSQDPTFKVLKHNPEERVRAITREYGEHLKPAWQDFRRRLGEPVQ